MKQGTREVFHWLARDRVTVPTQSLHHNGRPLTGDALHDHIATFWKNVWPSNEAEANVARQQQVNQLAQADTPWPAHGERPSLAPLTPEDFRRTFHKMQRKAAGPDQWHASELCHLPDDILVHAVRLFQSIEEGSPWPTALATWRQIHLLKPNKEAGSLHSVRPLSIGSIWYRAWAHIRTQQLSAWVESIMPQSVHGGIRKRGIHTALLKPLTAVENQQAFIQQHGHSSHTLPTFIGAADLSKAFDRLSADFAIAALSRMGLPLPIVSALQRAWHDQQRWIFVGDHVGSAPLTDINVLPQGDPFPPLALNACIAEAIHRIATQYGAPSNLHAAYLDDRTWTAATAEQCLDIADAWTVETRNLGLTENQSKLEFSAVGPKPNIDELAFALRARALPNPPNTRPKILGTRLILNRRHAGAIEEEQTALDKALRLTNWVRTLPYTLEEKLYFYKATAIAVVAAQRYVRLYSQADLDPIRRAMGNLDNTGQASLGHTGPLWRLFQGHTADPYFRAGSCVALQVLLESSSLPVPQWHEHQTQGPQCLLKRWLQRQGWECIAPWAWLHEQARLTLSFSPRQWPDSATDYCNVYPQLTAEGKRVTSHFLREAWRAKQWTQFLQSGSRAANFLQGLTWPDVRPQWLRARKMLNNKPDIYRHLLAIFIDHWVSQARILSNQQQPVAPCLYCNHPIPDRHHEWWTCPVLAPDRANYLSDNDLFNTLGWPKHPADEAIVASLARTRQKILTERYP